MTDYCAPPDSLASRLIAFFERCPEEELTVEDITVKFDRIARGSIHAQLERACSAGHLQRSMTSSGVVYRAAPAKPPQVLEEVRMHLLAAMRELKTNSPTALLRIQAMAEVGAVLVESARVEVEYLKARRRGEESV